MARPRGVDHGPRPDVPTAAPAALPRPRTMPAPGPQAPAELPGTVGGGHRPDAGDRRSRRRRARPASRRGRRHSRTTLLVLAVAGPVLVLGAGLNLMLERQRAIVEADLATVQAAAGAVPAALAPGRIEGLDARLTQQAAATDAAVQHSSGRFWRLASRAPLAGRRPAELRATALSAAPRARQARRLARALAPFIGGAPDASAGARVPAAGAPDPTAADTRALGEAFDRYADSSRRIGDPAADPASRAGRATALLPALTGRTGPGDQGRDWTVCTRSAGPCVSFAVRDGQAGTGAAASLAGDEFDLLVVGLDAGRLRPPDGAGALRQDRILEALLTTDGSIRWRSASAAEQEALDRLSVGTGSGG